MAVRLYGDTNGHAPGSQRVHNEKTPGLPRQRKSGAWSKESRMYNNDPDRFKMTGTIAAQTPSKRPHRVPSYKSTVQGAGKTAANQPRTERANPVSRGGQHV